MTTSLTVLDRKQLDAAIAKKSTADKVIAHLGGYRPLENKTESYTLTAADVGKIFTTRGAAGAVTFTLPAATSDLAGGVIEFYNVAGQNMTVAGADEGLVVFNDLTADSISLSTAAELIGGGFRAVCDGTSWIVVPLCTETQTITVASA